MTQTPAVLLYQGNDGLGQCLLFNSLGGTIELGAAALLYCPTGPALGD